MEETDSTWRLLFRLTEGIRNYHARCYPCPGPQPQITLSQIRVLSCVFMSPSGCVRSKEIAGELGITPGAVSQTVDNLVRRGLLRREADENDRRAVAISLSEKGTERHRTMCGQFARIVREMTDSLPPEEAREFHRILEKLLAVLAVKKQQEIQ